MTSGRGDVSRRVRIAAARWRRRSMLPLRHDIHWLETVALPSVAFASFIRGPWDERARA